MELTFSVPDKIDFGVKIGYPAPVGSPEAYTAFLSADAVIGSAAEAEIEEV